MEDGTLCHKELVTHGCIFSTVATDGLVLPHQAISTHSADSMFIILDQCHTKILHLQWPTQANRIKFWNKISRCFRVKIIIGRSSMMQLINLTFWWKQFEVYDEYFGERWPCYYSTTFNILSPWQNGRHFPDDIIRCISKNEKFCILIDISLKFFPKGRINNIPALVQIMAWRWPGGKSLSEPMMVSLLMHICVTWPQWVNVIFWKCRLSWGQVWSIDSMASLCLTGKSHVGVQHNLVMMTPQGKHWDHNSQCWQNSCNNKFWTQYGLISRYLKIFNHANMNTFHNKYHGTSNRL